MEIGVDSLDQWLVVKRSRLGASVRTHYRILNLIENKRGWTMAIGTSRPNTGRVTPKFMLNQNIFMFHERILIFWVGC
jgi:hypothetical protein